MPPDLSDRRESKGACRWLALLEDGRFNSVGELAEAVACPERGAPNASRRDMDPSLLLCHLALTSLKPTLVRQILDGVEPEGLSLKQLLKGVEVV